METFSDMANFHIKSYKIWYGLILVDIIIYDHIWLYMKVKNKFWLDENSFIKLLNQKLMINKSSLKKWKKKNLSHSTIEGSCALY